MLLHYVLTTSFLVRGDYVVSTHYNHFFFDLTATYKSINFAVVFPFYCFLLLVVTRISDFPTLNKK